MIIERLRSQRQQMGLTQQKLAELAAVSLPTVQNIERGLGNPSLDVLMKLAQALGLTLSIDPAPVDWDLLAYLGVPLTSAKKNIRVKKDSATLVMKLREAILASQNAPADRNIEALAGTLLAIQTHWPSLFNKFGSLKAVAEALISRQDPARLLKLRSMAINNLQGYL